MPATLREECGCARGRGASGMVGYKRMEARFGVEVLLRKKVRPAIVQKSRLSGWSPDPLVEEGG